MSVEMAGDSFLLRGWLLDHVTLNESWARIAESNRGAFFDAVKLGGDAKAIHDLAKHAGEVVCVHSGGLFVLNDGAIYCQNSFLQEKMHFCHKKAGDRMTACPLYL